MSENHRKPSGEPGAHETRSADTIRARLSRELDPRRDGPIDVPPIPDHQLLHRIGNGSYGDVWLARSALGTLRAVKIVYRARFKDDRPYEREFSGILKYEPISRTHEGLVQILHVGRNDSARCFYYVMELADNDDAESEPAPEEIGSASLTSYRPRTLGSELSHRERLLPTEAGKLTLMLARALAHLHQHGLVHRDIKPSNIIFVGGQPKLADIGLVTDVGSSRSFVGTEGFIPPEGPGTPQADLYGLGKLLYELATGRDRMDFPQLPHRLHHLPDGEGLLELNEVITRACAPEVSERYSTATELQADLNSFLAGRSIRRARNLERYLARLKKVVAATCGFLVLFAVALWFSKQEERHARETARIAIERAQAEAENRTKEIALRLRAEAAEQETEQQLYTALLEQARATVRSGELGQRVRALDAIGRAAVISNHVDLRREAIAALALPDLRFNRQMPIGTEFTLRLLDPAFERIALCRGRGPVEIRSVPDNQLIATLPASTNLMTYGAHWSSDGRFLAIKRDYDDGGYRADLEVWEVQNLRRVLLLQDVRANARSFHPLKPQILVAGSDGWVVAWDLEAGKELARRKTDARLDNLVYSPNGTLVVASYGLDQGWGVSVHKVTDSELIASQRFTNLPSTLAWHPDGGRLAVADYGGQVHLMDARTGQLQLLGRHKAEAATAVFSPSGDYLLTGGWERELICWDARTMKRALSISLDSYISQFRADGQACALFTPVGVQLHDFENPIAHRELAPEMGPRLWYAVFSPDGRWLAASADKQVGVWDLSGRSPGVLTNVAPEMLLFWTPDGSELFGSSRGDNCFRWRIVPSTNTAMAPTMERLDLPRPPGFNSFSMASNRIAWTTVNGTQITGLESIPQEENWVETPPGISKISPDGHWLGIYRPYGQILHLYRLPGMEPVARLTNQAAIGGFNFAPTGEEIAVASRRQVEFWSTITWERTRMATNFIGIPYTGTLFEPDGKSMWLAKGFHSAGLFRSTNLDPQLFLPNGMLPLAHDSSGRHLAVSLDAQQLQVWDMQTLRGKLRELGLDWSDH